jgi:GTP-binding protein
VVADIPGLIEGAHEGAGLGDRFLGHVERCSVLLHLVDGTAENPVANYKTIRSELAAYGRGIADKPEIVVLTKADALDKKAIDVVRQNFRKKVGIRPPVMSAVSGDGVTAVLRALATEIADVRGVQPGPAAAAREDTWRP